MENIRPIHSGSDDDLLPLSRPEKLGLPFQRRVLSRRIAAGTFPQPLKINGRLFITRAQLTEYKAQLISEGAAAHGRKLTGGAP